MGVAPKFGAGSTKGVPMNPELAELARLRTHQALAGLMKKKDQKIVRSKEEQDRLLDLERNLILLPRARRTQ